MAFVFLNSATELHQLMQWPFLLQHFREHRTDTPDMGIFAFLRLHYLDLQHPNDQDEEQDQQLPFKSPGSIQHMDLPPWQDHPVQIDGLPVTGTAFRNTYISGILPKRPFTVFHPPR